MFFGGKRAARREPAGAVYYYFSDHLGSADVVTDAAGVIKEESDYFPYGGERVLTDLLPKQNYKFTGKERDTESGLDYFGARYYANISGRFTSVDPKGLSLEHLLHPQKLNKYSYVLNHPLGFIDQDGQEEKSYLSRVLSAIQESLYAKVKVGLLGGVKVGKAKVGAGIYNQGKVTTDGLEVSHVAEIGAKVSIGKVSAGLHVETSVPEKEGDPFKVSPNEEKAGQTTVVKGLEISDLSASAGELGLGADIVVLGGEVGVDTTKLQEKLTPILQDIVNDVSDTVDCLTGNGCGQESKPPKDNPN